MVLHCPPRLLATAVVAIALAIALTAAATDADADMGGLLSLARRLVEESKGEAALAKRGNHRGNCLKLLGASRSKDCGQLCRKAKYEFCLQNCAARLTTQTCPAANVKDRSSRCALYKGKGQCEDEKLKRIMSVLCAKTCGACVMENSKPVCTARTGYGCYGIEARLAKQGCRGDGTGSMVCKGMQVIRRACDAFKQTQLAKTD